MIESYLRANNLFVDYNEVKSVYCSFHRHPFFFDKMTCKYVGGIEC